MLGLQWSTLQFCFMRLFTKGHAKFKCTFCSLCLHCLLSFEILEIKLISTLSPKTIKIISRKMKNNHFSSKTYIVVNIYFFNLSFRRPILITFCSHGNDWTTLKTLSFSLGDTVRYQGDWRKRKRKISTVFKVGCFSSLSFFLQWPHYWIPEFFLFLFLVHLSHSLLY